MLDQWRWRVGNLSSSEFSLMILTFNFLAMIVFPREAGALRKNVLPVRTPMKYWAKRTRKCCTRESFRFWFRFNRCTKIFVHKHSRGGTGVKRTARKYLNAAESVVDDGEVFSAAESFVKGMTYAFSWLLGHDFGFSRGMTDMQVVLWYSADIDACSSVCTEIKSIRFLI